ncbi:uncharacterized protein [Ambystoma mexicanum]|uniref:uncharacterized protein n=1 Tax=Ambystoma mexicanum TaxID=8296 RepID=UPI0037E8A46F
MAPRTSAKGPPVPTVKRKVAAAKHSTPDCKKPTAKGTPMKADGKGTAAKRAPVKTMPPKTQARKGSRAPAKDKLKIGVATGKRKADLSEVADSDRGSGKKQKTGEESRVEFQASLPVRNKKGELVFDDFPNFRPNMTPKEVLQAGSFGGTYFRPIYSGVTKQNYKDAWKELPKDWLEDLDLPKQVASSLYREAVNTYKVKCGGSLDMWESHGWITPQDPYGWFQWYCRFYQGRRTLDDLRQIGRWDRCTGKTGRWRGNLISKIVQSGCAYDNKAVSPVVRQTLQHWGYRLTPEDFEQGAKKARKRLK